MADHAITLATPYSTGPDDSGLVFEDVQVVGTAGTTGTYTCQFVKQPQRVLGDFSATFSGAVVTLTSAAFTGTRWARILGFV